MKQSNDLSLVRIISAKRESKYLDFKEKFDPNQARDWCEIIKDMVAMANSGGGIIIIGAKNDGTPSKEDISAVLQIDPAQITDKIVKYTGEQFDNFSIQEVDREEYKTGAFQVGGVSIPMVFIQPGTYDVGGGRQNTAFSRGSIYFRHGAKSEPGDTKDLEASFKKELEHVKKSWLGGIRKVVNAPTGYKVELLPPEVVESDLAGATPIRIVDDPTAPAYRKINPDNTHPHRQKEIVQFVNQRLGSKKTITPYDIQCVRKLYKIDSRVMFYYKSKFASPQYSNAFVDWLIEQFDKDPEFFDKARQRYKSETQT